MNRDLPALDAFLDEILVALGGGTKSILATGQWPAGAVAIDGHHLLLVRDHGHAVSVSLPKDTSWSLRTREDWRAAQDPLRKAVALYREKNKGAVSMADVLVALGPRTWLPSFPGTPVPSEAWIATEKDPDEKVGLFQSDNQVNVIVWVGSSMRSKSAGSREALYALAAWIPPQLADQRKAAAAEVAEKAREKARPVPSLDAVMAILKSGKRIATGGGRYYETYFITDGKLRCEIFDEGYTDVRDATEEELQRSIDANPDRFRRAP